MSRSLFNKITLVLAAVGCIIALVLTYEHFFPAADIGCGAIGGNCHNTIESKYGKLGPIPTSLIGLGMYLTLAGICVLRGRSLSAAGSSGSEERPLGMALFGISALAFGTSWWLQYVSFFVIYSFCPWCFASALTVTAIFLVNAYDFLILGKTLTGEQKMLSGVLAFIGVMLAFLYAPQVIAQYILVVHPPRHAPPKDMQIDPNAPPIPYGVGNHPREEILSKGLVFKGKPTAQYTIVEFADYGCSHCKEASIDVDLLVKHYPDRYRLAFRNYPLGRWPWSLPEAIAATAAARQGKFWEMHDIMFLHQDELDQPGFGLQQIMNWAKSIGLDVKKLSKDMEDPAIKDQVNHDREVGYINNIVYTPSFYIVPSDPKGKVQMITGDTDMKTVLANPNDPFWKGDLSGLTNKETQNRPPNLPR